MRKGRHLLWVSVAVCCLGVLAFAVRRGGDGYESHRKEGIVFSGSYGEIWQIFTIDPSGGEPVQLTHASIDAQYPAWSPQGNSMAYSTTEGEIRILRFGSESIRLPGLAENCSHPTWSPDGNRIAVTCYSYRDRLEDSDIWVADLEHGQARKLMEQPGSQKYPAWSPDGSLIAYTNGYRASGSKIIEELWVVSADGSNPKPLIANGFSNIQPDWSPLGDKIAFASNQRGNMDIWVIDKDGADLRQLTVDQSYDSDPSWSPDGSRICFVSTSSGKMEIWTIEANGDNPKQLTGLGSMNQKFESKEPNWLRMGRSMINGK